MFFHKGRQGGEGLMILFCMTLYISRNANKCGGVRNCFKLCDVINELSHRITLGWSTKMSS